MPKIYRDKNVYEAAMERYDIIYKNFDHIYFSVSGGKDSSIMLQLAAGAARRTGKKISVLYIDLEAQYQATIDHVDELIRCTADVVDAWYWVAMPLSLRNAASAIRPKWICWDKKDRKECKMKYYSLNEYLRHTFGTKAYKISLDAGCSCPNRDGLLDTRGCIFCSASGSGDFAEHLDMQKILQKTRRGEILTEADQSALRQAVQKQLIAGKARVEKKNKAGKYIAYFQAYTGTYAPVSYLRPIFEAAIEPEDVLALSVATRPDCLDDAVLDLLEELNAKKPVWVELGLQTIHPATAEYIRRGYPLSVYDAAVGRLKKRGLEVIVHVILGLPGETTDMMKETVSYVGVSGADGIKLQLLHILKGTDLEKEYEAGRCPVFSMEEYVGLVADCISLLPKDMVIHRMTGDGDKKTLLAPLWSADKKRVWNALQREIASR